MIGVKEWFKDQTVFLTGGTGFLGKALIFKLLKCGCSKIYISLRPKKGQTLEERFKYITEDYAYDSLRNKIDFNKVLIPIPLNYHAEDGLGISDEHKQILWDEVTVVIHSAASVAFGLPIKIIVLVNLKLTRDLLEFSKGMKNLKVFNHISTAYSNCEYMTKGKGSPEKILKPKMDWRLIIKAAETMPHESLNLLESKLCGESPNTYVFTKHLAEAIVGEYSTVLPAVITRPAIVLPAVNEPAPGWMQNLNGPGGAILATSKGVLRAMAAGHVQYANVPVDFAINGICCVTWYAGTGQCSELEQVFTNKPLYLTPKQVNKFEHSAYDDYPSYRPLWYPISYHVSFRIQYYILNILLHLIPGLIIDGFLRLAGQKPQLLTTYRKIYYAFYVMQPFMQNKQIFPSDNFETVMQKVPDKEKEDFPYYAASLDALTNFARSISIAYRIFAKEPPISEGDKKYMKMMKKIHIVTKYLLWALFFYFLPYSYIYSLGLAVLEYFVHFFDVSRFQ